MSCRNITLRGTIGADVTRRWDLSAASARLLSGIDASGGPEKGRHDPFWSAILGRADVSSGGAKLAAERRAGVR